MLPRGRYHPFQLDTRGLATVLQAVAKHKVQTCLIGIGGSATNDGGFGLAVGLGWQFLDRFGRPLQRWTDLSKLVRIVSPPAPHPLRSLRVLVATDVENPLLGPRGATRIYGPQKGILPGDLGRAERALRRLSVIVRNTLGGHLDVQPGAGAAGGLGFGLTAFARATLQSGFDLYAGYAKLNAHLRWADLLVTGEGQMDASTLMGKGVGELARRAQSRHLPCIGIAGSCHDRPLLAEVFVAIGSLTPERFSQREAMHRPERCLRQLSFELGSTWTPRRPP
jgi:glycerate kinase